MVVSLPKPRMVTFRKAPRSPLRHNATMPWLTLLLLTCGSERWEVKVLRDPEAHEVDLGHVREASVSQLAGLPAPAYADRARRVEAEKRVYAVAGYVMGYKLEQDGDVHIVVADAPDGSGPTFIAEIPSSDCLEGSRAQAPMEEARRAFLALFQDRPPAARYRPLRHPLPVLFTGVGFFDKLHAQKGVAPNGFELHPVLSVSRR